MIDSSDRGFEYPIPLFIKLHAVNKSSRSSCRRHSGPSSGGSNTRTLPTADTESDAAPIV